MRRKIEILAPAGDMICLQAALDAGADAVYLGLGGFDMRRIVAGNFTAASLADAAARCRARGAKLYLALNTIVFEGELAAVREQLAAAKPHVDAVIAADWAVCGACRELGIPFHVSTQMSCSNSQAAAFLKAQGASRIVLARECTLDEVARIAAAADVEIEVFVHGATCVAESGRCLLSHEAYGHSASRGDCRQPCRRRYRVHEVREGDGSDAEFEVESHAVFSARDLCSLPFLDRLAATGAASFKIEGRARNADYVRTVVGAYREGVDAVADGRFTPELAEALVARVSRVYHREFGAGLYHGRPGAEQFATLEENQATHIKRHAGIVLHYYPKAKVAQVLVQDSPIRTGDELSIQGPTTGVVAFEAGPLRREEEVVAVAERGNWVTLACPSPVRVNDKVFRVEPVRASGQN